MNGSKQSTVVRFKTQFFTEPHSSYVFVRKYRNISARFRSPALVWQLNEVDISQERLRPECLGVQLSLKARE